MRELITKYLGKSIAFGIIMTFIGFSRGDTAPVWLDLIRLFLIYSVTFLAVNVLADWIHGKLKKD